MARLCVGDTVCLFSEDVHGYVFSTNTSRVQRQLAAWPGQDRDNPDIPDVQVVSFEICVANRYKLAKQFRKLQEKKAKILQAGNEIDPELQGKIARSKNAFDTETEANESEQRRQRGETLHYGQTIQLRHVFTNKYVHVSTTETSTTENNAMLVELLSHNAKQTMFKIQPRYKVQSEGNPVFEGDRIILESVKTPGQVLNVSDVKFPSKSSYAECNEINLSVHRSVFTLTRRYQRTSDNDESLRAGMHMRIFHKEIEAYLCAEGIPDGTLTTNVHFRVRRMNLDEPKTIFPSTSGIVYWQLESQSDPLSGEPIKWGHQCHFRHMITRQYLCVTPDLKVTLTPIRNDPNTVFKLHPVSQISEDIPRLGFCRIEHVMTESWLHALSEVYSPKSPKSEKHSESMIWSTAPLLTVGLSQSMQFADAFTIESVEEDDLINFNFALGMVPLVLRHIDQAHYHETLCTKDIHHFIQGLTELKNFMIVRGLPEKNKQKLVRNVQLVDLLVNVLKIPNVTSNQLLVKLKVEAYNVLRTYLKGDSRKNELYLARHNGFFYKQSEDQSPVGISATNMLVELVRDNRTIVDYFNKVNIKRLIHLLKKNKNPQFLDLLGVLCVCDGLAIPENQDLITQVWLTSDQMESVKAKAKSPRLKNKCVFHTDVGQNIGLDSNSVYVSTDNKKTWSLLTDFVSETHSKVRGLSDVEFLNSQMDLFGKLCYGGNTFPVRVITEDLGYVTWEEAFLCLTNEALPHALRANYCSLTTGLFVDVEGNQSVVDKISLCYDYDLVTKTKATPRQGTSRIVQLQEWISKFLAENRCMVSADIGYNKLIEKVLFLVSHLVKFGFYGNTHSLTNLLGPLLSLLDGRNDIPFQPRQGSSVNEDVLAKYRRETRYKPSLQTQIIVDAKYQAIEVLKLLLKLRFITRLETLVGEFKMIEHDPHGLEYLMETKYVVGKNPGLDTAGLELLETILKKSDYLKDLPVVDTLLDLASYEYEEMVVKSTSLLNVYYSERETLFHEAVQAQLLITDKSREIQAEVGRVALLLGRAGPTTMTDKQAAKLEHGLDSLARHCFLDKEMSETHSINQTIIFNHGILQDLLAILRQAGDTLSQGKHKGMRRVCDSACLLMKGLAMDHPAVQARLFDCLDMLLDMKGGFEGPQSEALLEVFIDNRTACMKVTPKQLHKMILLVVRHGQTAAQLLQLLRSLVKVERFDLPLKRNQSTVINYFTQYRTELAQALDESTKSRLEALKADGSPQQQYLVSLMDLLATCAEGDSPVIESICQTILQPDELLDVLSSNDVTLHIKRPYLRYLLWVYIRTDVFSDFTQIILANDVRVWHMMDNFSELIKQLAMVVRKDPETTCIVLRLASRSRYACSKSTSSNGLRELLTKWTFVLDAVMPFFLYFFMEYDAGDGGFHENVVSSIATNVQDLAEAILPFVTRENVVKSFIRTVETIVPKANLSRKTLTGLQLKYGSGNHVTDILSDKRKMYMNYYKEEIILNRKFNVFCNNLKVIYGGKNDMWTQTGYPSAREYSALGSDEELPLGKDFQDHLQCFMGRSVGDRPAPCHLADKLLQRLAHSSHVTSDKEHMTRQRGDVRSLQLLRAALHNQINKLPPEAAEHATANKKQWIIIEETQNAICDQDAISKTLPLMASTSDDVIKEELAFLAAMLFGGNPYVQEKMLEHFMESREERFFVTIQKRLQMSALAMKERRSMLENHRASIKKGVGAETSRETTRVGQLVHWREAVFHGIRKQFPKARESAALLESDELGNSSFNNLSMSSNVSLQDDIHTSESSTLPIWGDEQSNIFNQSAATSSGIEFKDDGYLGLMLNVLASMCDGQNREVQNYIREQKDNFKSVNLVAEVTEFLDHLYSSIDGQTITVTTQLFQTLVEFTSGNHANQVAVIEGKVCDYISLVLHEVDFPECTLEQILELKHVMGNLVRVLTEENMEPQDDETSSEATNIPEIVMRSLEPAILFNVAEECWARIHSKARSSPALKNLSQSVGFCYFHIIQRMKDIQEDDVHLRNLLSTVEDSVCWKYYRDATMSVEVLKDNQMHKLYFPAHDQAALTEYTKKTFNYNVDRNPSERLHNFMRWVPDIMSHITYKRRVRKWMIGRAIVYMWWPANMLMMFLSFLALLLQMITWIAPADVNSPVPVYRYTWSPTAMTVICGLHNVVTICVLLSFWIIYCPMFPKLSSIKASLRSRMPGFVDDKPHKEEEDEKASVLDTRFFSFKTFWYLTLLVMSGLGTAFYGYFLAIHLLNVAEFVQLIKKTIEAITKNGRAFLLIYLFSLVFFFIYAQLTFAFYRELMDSNSGLYCTTMYECFITVNHHGLLTGFYEGFEAPEGKSISWLGWKALFDLSFFIIISTIGLNIIFGIIVDTFAEFRDLQWQIENEMMSNCFICQRECHEFETKPGGFENHIKQEHNQWAYVFFLIHLSEVQQNNYTALELYVSRKVEKEEYDFFPVNRAMSLEHEDDWHEIRLQILEEKIGALVNKVKQLESERERELAHQKQHQWEEKHKTPHKKKKKRASLKESVHFSTVSGTEQTPASTPLALPSSETPLPDIKQS